MAMSMTRSRIWSPAKAILPHSRITRRRAVRSLLAGTALPLLAACAATPASSPASVTPPKAAPTSASAPPATTAPNSAAKVVLRNAIANSTLEVDLNKQITAAFMKEHPNVEVKVEPIPGNYAIKYFTEAAANTLQDVIRTADVHTAEFAVKNIVQDMQPYATGDKGFNMTDVYKVMLDLGRTGLRPGGLFMIPRALDILVLYYNKSMFDKAGVGLPKPDWTIQDLVDAAIQLTKPSTSPQSAQYGISLNWTWWAEYVPWMRGYGGDVASGDGKQFTGDQPDAAAGIQAMADLIVKHKAAPPVGASFGGDPFATGHVAMSHTIRDLVPTFRQGIANRFEWDVQIWPTFPKSHVTGMGTQGVAVGSQTKNPYPAWDLAKYYVSTAGQRVLAATYTTVPVRISMADDPSWRKLSPPPSNNDVFTKSAAFGTLPPTFPLSCGNVYTGQIQQVMNNTLDEILRGTVTAQAGLRKAAEQINACLTQTK